MSAANRYLRARDKDICIRNSVETGKTDAGSGITPPGGMNSHQKILNKAFSEGHMNQVVTVLDQKV